MCSGDSSGVLNIDDISGDHPPFIVNLYNVDEVDPDFIQFYDPIYSDTLETPVGGNYTTDFSNLIAGDYFLVAFDTVGCRNDFVEDVITLNEPDPISIEKQNAPYHILTDTVFDISCFGAQDALIDIAVTGGHTDYLSTYYSWSGPDIIDTEASNQLDSILGPGLYSVVVRDSFDCTGSAQFMLSEPPQILYETTLRDTNTWNITCFGENDGVINLSSEGGIGSHSYLWESEQPLSDPESGNQDALYAGFYNLTIRDSLDCLVDTTIELIQPNPLSLSANLSGQYGFEILCATDSTGEIFLTPLGGADSLNNTYSWNASDGGFVEDADLMDQHNLPAGTYKVSVTDINGCPFDTTFILEEPDSIKITQLESDSANCASSATGSIELEVEGGFIGGSGDYGYSWTGGDGADSIQDPDGLIAGWYVITIMDDNYCTLIDSVYVGEADRFDVDTILVSDFNGVSVSCAGYSDGMIVLELLGGTPPYHYLWNTGDTTQALEGIPAGTYTVDIMDHHNCPEYAEVVITEPTPISFDLGDENPLCYGDSTGQINLLLTGGTINGVSDYRVWLNDVFTGPYTDNLPAGTYDIRIRDLNDCLVDTVAELIDPEPLELEFDTEKAFCPDKPDGRLELIVRGGTGIPDILWDGGLLENEDYFSDIYSGSYVATVTDRNGCVTIDTVTVGYEKFSCLVIPNAFSPNSDGYNDLWVIEGLELYNNVELRIFDRWGSLVFHTPNAEGDQWDGSFNGRELPVDSYHYVLIIKHEGETQTETGNITIVR
jgi:gliding motility-associated-like protein